MWWAVIIAQRGDVVSAEVTDVDDLYLHAFSDHCPGGEVGAVAVTEGAEERQLLLGIFLIKCGESVFAYLAV